MKDSFVLDGMPELISGTGESPAEGGCIMQVVSHLWNGGWNDHPICVLPALQNLAIEVNDSVGTKDRQELWELLPRLMGTGRTKVEEELIFDDTSEVVRSSYYEVMDNEGNLPINRHISEWLAKHDCELFPFTRCRNVALLRAALDEYDRFTGRKPEETNWDEEYAQEVKASLEEVGFVRV